MKEVVSGKSLVSLSATCQTTFDNSTPNHLNPQARVGEQLEVTINLENTFSTPLQLRNMQLLLKFESEGEGGEVTSSPIESVTLERNSKQEVRMQFKATTWGEDDVRALAKRAIDRLEACDSEAAAKAYSWTTLADETNVD